MAQGKQDLGESRLDFLEWSEQNWVPLPGGMKPKYLYIDVYVETLSWHRAAALCLQLSQF